VDQRPDRRIFLVLGHGGVIEGAQEIASRVKLAQETLVIDIETERLGGGVEIGAVNEKGHFFRFWFHDCSLVTSSKNSITTPECARPPDNPSRPAERIRCTVPAFCPRLYSRTFCSAVSLPMLTSYDLTRRVISRGMTHPKG